MAIPDEFRTPELEEIDDQFKKAGISSLQRLTENQEILLCRVVHLYSWVELNLRRCLEYLIHKGYYSEEYNFAGSVKIYSLVNCVKIGAKNYDRWSIPTETFVETLDDIERCRPYRNLFAHWAAGRFRGEYIVFLTRNDLDAKQATGHPLIAGTLANCLMKEEQIRDLTARIGRHANWISARVPEIATAT